jgi:crossover junction endonuclease MUS81
MKIIIDERETSLYSGSYSLLENSSYSHISLSKEVLPLGDILIKDDQDIPLILIERKSINDLLASIKDGRYEEQSYRLMNSAEFPVKQTILYIIEGMFTYHQDKKTVLSAMTSLQFFKGFSVQRTCSILETAEYIIHMTDKIHRDLKKGKVFAFHLREQNLINMVDTNTNVPAQPYCTVVKKVKKDNITSQNMGEILLCQIPGISANAAIAILKHTNGSFLQLLEILKTNPSELNTITVGEKGRKINKSIIEKMRELLLV